MPEYPQEQLQELYNNLPEELQMAMFSEQNAQNIREICEKNGVADEDIIFDIAKNVGYVLLGLLPPEEFPVILEEELKIQKLPAGNIAKGISRFIFYPVRRLLETLYDTKLTFEKPQAADDETSPVSLREKEELKGKDTYREPIQ
jgi:hypothetical protein